MSAQRSGMKLSYLGSDADEVADVLARCIGPVNVQRPRNTEFSYGYEFVAAGSAAFSRVTCQGSLSIGQKNEVPKLLVLLPLDGPACVDIGKKSLYSGPGKGAVLDGNRLSRLRIDGTRSHFSLVIDQGDIIRHLGTVLERPVYGTLDFAPEFSLEEGSGQIIFRLAQIMARCLGDDAEIQDTPQTLSYLSKTFINLLVETVPHRFSEALNQGEWLPSPRHVKRAVDFMHANLSSPLSMTEIAQAAGIGIRSLQEGFKRFKGTSPTSYLTQLRMEAAHRDLIEREPTMSVSDIARKWGFRHMGRFSSDYRKSYGQPPSQTRKGRSRP
jgi:AraC-like DNA-binding protein